MKKILFIAFYYFCSCSVLQAQKFTSADFNTGTLGQGLFNTTSGLCNQPLDGYLTDSFSTDGGKSFRTQVNKTDGVCGYSYRSEMHLSPFSTIMQSTEWIQWDTYQPAWQGNDTIPYISGQIHGDSIVPMGLWFLKGTQVQLVLQSRITGKAASFSQKTFPLGNYAKGQWHRWILHFKRAIDNTGLVEFWADGVKKVSYVGPTTDLIGGLPEILSLYFKFGEYKWSVKKGQLPYSVCYTDNLVFGDATATINDFVLQHPSAPPAPQPKYFLSNTKFVKLIHHDKKPIDTLENHEHGHSCYSWWNCFDLYRQDENRRRYYRNTRRDRADVCG